MNNHLKIPLILLIFCFACAVQAQDLDSLTAVDAKYDSILRSDDESMNTLFYKHQNDALINNLGPYGSPFYYPTAFFLQKKRLIPKTDPINSKLYNLSGYKPYTNITWINAGRKEQLFSIKHIQEFGKLLFLDFDFNKLSSPGAYINQEANNTSFEGNLKYQSKKNNYEIKFSNGIYRNFYQENGGLSNIKDYETSLYDDERTYDVYLKKSNAFMKRYRYQLEQRLDLFQFGSDSLPKKQVYLKHHVSYTTQQKVFFDEDPSSGLYSETHLDTISSIDSIYTNNISNTGYIGYRNNILSIELFGQYDQNEFLQNFGISRIYHNTYAGIAGGITNKLLKIDLIGKYGIKGYNAGDIETELALIYQKEKYHLEGGASYFLNEPDLKFTSYTSNHFIWDNPSLSKQSVLDFHINFRLKASQLEFKAESKVLNNTLYYDTLALASQDNKTATISSFSLAKNYRLLNFHFRTAFIYQLTSDEVLFPLPEVIGRQILYYQKPIFKGALKFQFGIGFSYSTDYLGYAYMPAINEFYLQKDMKLGYYPKIDVFINTHLKRAQIFLKYEHFNAGRSLHKSNGVPGYPPMSKSLKFGVSWNMFD